MKLRVTTDLHCHSVASTHAFSTIKEICECANKHGLSLIALTNHVPPMDDAPNIFHFSSIFDIPRHIEDVMVLRGAESSIIDVNGNIDLQAPHIHRLEVIIASFHVPVYIPPTQEDYLKALLNLIENKYVHIIGHIGRIKFKLETQTINKIVKKAKEYNKLIEINESTIRNNDQHQNNCLNIAKMCKKYDAPIVVNSDCHICYQVGKFPKALEMLESIGMPQANIINSSKEKILEHLALTSKFNC